MAEIDRAAYDEWVELETKRRRIGHRIIERVTLTIVEPFQPLIYDEWLKAGKPDEGRIRAVLAAFGGRPELAGTADGHVERVARETRRRRIGQ